MSERRFGAAAVELSGIAAALLGWRPAEFWAATPAELERALNLPGGEAGVDRGLIDALQTRFPDE